MTEQWIVIPRWDEFQHRDMARSSVPPWIKVYTQLHDDDDFLKLTFRQRGILLGIWIAYARSRRQLSASPSRISRILGAPTAHERQADGQTRARRGSDEGQTVASAWSENGQSVVRSRDLEALKQAGFIEFSASRPARNVASNPASLEVEVEKIRGSKGSKEQTQNRLNGQRRRAAENWIRNGLAAHVPADQLPTVLADEFHIDDPAILDELVQQANPDHIPY